MLTRRQLAQLAAAILGAALWWTPAPDGLSLQAWRLFAVFVTAIFSVVLNALPILTASVLAVAVAVLTRTSPAGRRLRRLCQQHDPAHRRCFSGGQCRGEVRPRQAWRYWIAGRFGGSTLGLLFAGSGY